MKKIFQLSKKTLIAKLMDLKEEKTHLFRKVIFYKNEIQITLVHPWSQEHLQQVENMIRWSWPELFLHANP